MRKTMLSALVVAGWMGLTPCHAMARPVVLSSQGIKARIDANSGRLTEVRNILTGEVYSIASDECRIQLDSGTINTRDVKMKPAARTRGAYGMTGRAGNLEITMRYSISGGRAYFDRMLTIKNVGTTGILIRKVTGCALVFRAPFSSTAFHDDNMDQCDPGSQMYSETEEPVVYRTAINVFMRKGKGGLFAGLRYPYFKPDLANDRVALSYETNYRLRPGETLDLPTAFFGVFANTGCKCRKALDWKPRILSTKQEEMDWGEVRGMQQVMKDHLPEEPSPVPGYFMWLNSYWTTESLHGRISHESAEAYCKLAGSIKQSKCLDLMGVAPVWCGWAKYIEPCSEIDAVGADAVFPRNPEIDRVIAVAGELGVPTSGFCEPNSLNRHYRSDRPDWRVQPTSAPDKTLKQNCHANDQYEDWFYRLICSTIETCHLKSWSWDHCWVRRPMICYGKTHGHEPGNCEFQQYRNIVRLIRQLRSRYPHMFIEVYWGLKEAGSWSLRGLNSMENAYENGSPPPPGMTTADDLRFQHWFNHNYRFIPTYMNLAQINFKKEMNGHLYSLLSCLSASTHASLCDWIPFETDAQADAIFAPMRRWKKWATENMAYLRDRVDLFGQPCRKNGIDGTAHIIGNRGFIFVFNPTGEVRYGRIPLGDVIGLTRGKRFSLDEISSETRKRLAVCGRGEDFVCSIPAKSVILIELMPTNEAPKHALIPNGVEVQPAFEP